MILARILTPQDFGLVAMVTAFVAIVELLQSFGFDIALIQRRDASRDFFDSAWALNIVLALVCASVVALGAHQVALFYGEPRVQTVAYFLAIGVAIQGFENIGMVAFRKELAFRAEVNFILAKKVCAAAVTITLALILRNYWALVIGTLAGRSVGLVLSYWFHPFRPRFDFSRARILVHFSKWMLLNNMLAVSRERIGDLIVGRVFGAGPLGIFSVSMEIASLPTTELSAPINRVVFSGYSQWSESTHQLRDGFLKVIGIVFLVTIPATMGIAAIAEPLVLVMLGERWREAVDLIAILAFFGLTQALQSNFGYVFIAMGRPRYVTLWAGAMLACEACLALLGALHFGVKGAVWGLLVGGIIPMPFIVFALSRILKLSPRVWWAVAWRPVLATLTMLVAVHAWLRTAVDVWPAAPALVLLLSGVAIGFVTFVCVCYSAWWVSGRPAGPELAVQSSLRAMLNRITGKRN
jgi:O-antigen/teichoic acid export membrane protein